MMEPSKIRVGISNKSWDFSLERFFFFLRCACILRSVVEPLCPAGLSPDLQSMEQIRRIMRPTDVPDTGERTLWAVWFGSPLRWLRYTPENSFYPTGTRVLW